MSAVTRLLNRFLDEPTGDTPAAPRAELGVAFLEDRVVLSGSPAGVAQVASSVAGVLNQDVVAFDVTTKGRVTFNTSTGEFGAKVELPAGVTLDTPALKTLMSGQFAVPKVNPIQAASYLGGAKTAVTNDYDAVRSQLYQQYGGGNVYLASKQFTEWASAENVANTVAAAVLSSGSTAGQIIREAKEVMTAELSNIYTWLKVKAPTEAEATMAAALRAMVTGQEFNSPYLALKFVNVRQTYTVGLGGAAGVIADGLGLPAAKSVTSSHKGFALIWKGPPDGGTSLTKALDGFAEGKTPGLSNFRDAMLKLTDRPELKGLGKVADAVLQADAADAAGRAVVDKLSAALGVTRADLQRLYTLGNPTIDLTATQADEKLNAVLGKLAAGNEGTSRVTKLEFNLNTLEVTAEVEVRHRHTWGSVTEIFAAIGQKVGEWVDKAGNKVQQAADWAGNTIRTVGYKGADTMRETLTRTGELIGKTVTNSAGYKTLEATWHKGVKTYEVIRNKVGQRVQEFWTSGSQKVTTLYTNGVKSAEVVVQNGVKLADRAWKDGVKTLDVVRNTAGKLVSEYWKSGSETFQNLYTNGVRTAFSKWAGATNVAHYTYNAAGQYLSKYWVDGGRQISQWFSNGAVTAENVVKNGVRVAEKAWANGVNTLNRVRDDAGRMVSEYWKSGSDTFQNLYTNGVRTAYTKWTNGTTAVHNAYDRAGTIVTSYWREGNREFKNAYQNGKRVAQNVWENGKNVAQHVWNASGGYVGNALSNAGGTVSGTFKKIFGI